MLKELLKDHQTGMSEFQDDYLVTGRAGGTLYGQYKQALRELYKRFRGIREITCDIEKQEIETEWELAKSLKEPNSFEARLAKVEYKRKVMQAEEAHRLLKDTKREFNRFYQQASFLKKKIGPLTDETRKVLDREMWEFKIKEMMCVDWITRGAVSNNTFEFLHACPPAIKQVLMLAMKNQQITLEWYESRETILVPEELNAEIDIDFNNFKLLEEL